MVERGIAVDCTTIHRWTVRFAPLLLERFNRRKRSVTGKWHIDETYIKVRGQWQRDLPSPGGFSRRYWRVMADPTASSSTVARPTRRLLSPVTPQFACSIAPGAG